MSPGLTTAPSTKATKLTISGTLEGCTGFEGVVAKYPISAGKFTASLTLPAGGTCSGLNTSAVTKTKLSITWTGINPKTHKPATAATDSTTIVSIVENASRRGFDIVSAPLAGKKSVLLGKTISLHMVLDESAGTISTLCAAKSGLKLLHFTGINGASTLAVLP